MMATVPSPEAVSEAIAPSTPSPVTTIAPASFGAPAAPEAPEVAASATSPTSPTEATTASTASTATIVPPAPVVSPTTTAPPAHAIPAIPAISAIPTIPAIPAMPCATTAPLTPPVNSAPSVSLATVTAATPIAGASAVLEEGEGEEEELEYVAPLGSTSSGRKRWFSKELRCMMYGFGDDQNPYTESVDLLEDLVIEFITEMTHKGMEIGRTGRVQVEDIVFLVRKDQRKYARVKDLLTMNEELKKARKAFDEVKYVDPELAL